MSKVKSAYATTRSPRTRTAADKTNPFSADWPVFGRGKIRPSGRTTGATYRCQMDGCTGRRIVVRWRGGRITRPCFKGMYFDFHTGWHII